MRAEIVSIGTQLLLGELRDTNTAYLASRLPGLGIDLYYVHTVGDKHHRLLEVLQGAWSRADLVLCTGGLGPTEDDVTREAIAALLGETMTIDPGLERNLRRYFAGRLSMPENNLRQALLIPSAQALPNSRGTAPGWWVPRGHRALVAMPGPPQEMTSMWEEQVSPRLRAWSAGEVLVTRTLKITGISESAVNEMCGDLLRENSPTIGVYAKPEGIHLHLGVKASDKARAHLTITQTEQALREIFGHNIWGSDEETLEEHVGRLVADLDLTLGVMESCTGGLLASRITDAPGSSAYFRGGLVAYSNQAKIAHGVDKNLIATHGAVSPQVGRAMARAIRLHLRTDLGIGVTGVAGPTEQEGKPIGTVFTCVDGPKGAVDSANQYYGDRTSIKLSAANAALFQIRWAVLNLMPQLR